ncbi:MAG: Ig-like domain-containing protein [Candidatus Sulfotelmatobacter sp.]
MSRLKRALFFAIVLLPAILTTLPAFAETSAPTVVNSLGYINRKPLTSHTTASFNSGGASTIVVYLSSHPSWDGRPVAINGITDNAGNSWKVLEGPTPWAGSSFTLLSAIYYVNGPITSAEHQLTVNLSNPAPLVLHVIAVSGSDITAPPLHSAIGSLRPGTKSVEVSASPITVPPHTLLLAWAKNESIAKASALDDYILDKQSPTFLWGESKNALAGGSYASHFRYDTAIGYQTAIVGIKAATLPLAISQSIKTSRSTPVGISVSTLSPKGAPLRYMVLSAPKHGKLSGRFPNLTYTPDTDYVGTDRFTFQANDGTADTNTASVGIIVEKKNLISGLDGRAARIGAFSILWIAIVAMKQLLYRPGSFVRC